MSERNYLLLLGDIREAIRRIEEYTRGMNYALFDSNQLVQDAVYRNFEVIGEAAGKFSLPFNRHIRISTGGCSKISGMC